MSNYYLNDNTFICVALKYLFIIRTIYRFHILQVHIP